ncbi:HIT family protein [Candidatus Parcubacteria bacterium]|nr:MAG: HIT family protein [Candidatus Parcubacteria bacterium]
MCSRALVWYTIVCMASIFTKILEREIPAYIVYEDTHTFVIPDKFPSMRGQMLVITKREVPYILDLTPEEYEAFWRTTRRVMRAMDEAFSTERTCVVVEGFEVSHTHARLYPCRDKTLILNPRYEASDEELREVAERVRVALKRQR